MQKLCNVLIVSNIKRNSFQMQGMLIACNSKINVKDNNIWLTIVVAGPMRPNG